MITMRTTIDLPDNLFRQVKARAAVRGLKLKEYVAAALERSLLESPSASEIREGETAYAEEVLVLGEGCVLPLISGETSEAMKSLSGAKIEEILEQEDLSDALLSGGR